MTSWFRALYHPEEPISYREGLYIAGVVKGEEFKGKAMNATFTLILPLGIAHFLMKLVMEYDEVDTGKAMQIVHWTVVFACFWLCGVDMMRNTELFNELERIIKSGFFTYPEPITKEQKNVLVKGGKRIRLYIRLFFILLSFVYCFQGMKPLTSAATELIFIGWFPFEINTTFRYSDVLKNYMFLPLTILGVSIGILMCTGCFIFTDPDTDRSVAIPIFIVFILQLSIATLFCTAGQSVSTHSEELRLTLYSVKWYEQRLEFRKDIMIIHNMTKRVITVTAGGIQNYNHEGLKDVLQATYTYFNMLVALRSPT